MGEHGLMLQAQLRGKLTRSEQQLEDLITSDVFGLLKYVPPNDGLEHLLQLVVREDGSKPFENLSIANAEYPLMVSIGRGWMQVLRT